MALHKVIQRGFEWGGEWWGRSVVFPFTRVARAWMTKPQWGTACGWWTFTQRESLPPSIIHCVIVTIKGPLDPDFLSQFLLKHRSASQWLLICLFVFFSIFLRVRAESYRLFPTHPDCAPPSLCRRQHKLLISNCRASGLWFAVIRLCRG